MSDKDRQKKDHERTDKKNKRRRESENPRQQTAEPRHQAKDESNLTDTQPAAANSGRSAQTNRVAVEHGKVPKPPRRHHAQADADEVGRAVRIAGHVHHAGHALGDEVDAAQLRRLPHRLRPAVEATGAPQEAKGWRAETVTSALPQAWGMAWLPDGRMLVTERPGRLRGEPQRLQQADLADRIAEVGLRRRHV